MSSDLISDHFGSLVEAPHAISRLRELILDLAVRGRLVPQNTEDANAAELLERVQTQQRQMAESGLPEKKTTTPVAAAEPPFHIPSSWCWSRLRHVTSYIQRGKGPKYIEQSAVPIVSQKCVQWDGFNLGAARFLDPDFLERYRPERFLQTGDLLWNSTGTGTIGRVNIFPGVPPKYEKVVADSHVTVIRPIAILSEFIWIWLASPTVQNAVDDLATGTTKQTELGTETVRQHLVPIAPLAEQHRIVNKVDELMALCDELETQQQKRNKTRIALNNACLDQLVTAPDQRSFRRHWGRVRDHFDLLYDVPETVSRLRTAILRLAVTGRLVHQDPEDGLASDLLSESGIKPADISLDDAPHRLPEGWCWVFLGDLGRFMGGGTPSKRESLYWKGQIPWVTPKDMKRPCIGDSQLSITEEALQGTSVKLIPPGSILMVVRGMILSHSFPVAVTTAPVTVNQDMKALVLKDERLKEYLLLQLSGYADRILEEVERSTHGTCRLATGKISNFLLAIPPLVEQRRIVEKVQHLVRLCQELEIKLQISKTGADKLLESVAHYFPQNDSVCHDVDAFDESVLTSNRLNSSSEVPGHEADSDAGGRRHPHGAATGTWLDIDAPTPAERILSWLQERPGWHARSDVVSGLGNISVGEWNEAIRELVTFGEVERRGERRGARYRIHEALPC